MLLFLLKISKFDSLKDLLLLAIKVLVLNILNLLRKKLRMFKLDKINLFKQNETFLKVNKQVEGL